MPKSKTFTPRVLSRREAPEKSEASGLFCFMRISTALCQFRYPARLCHGNFCSDYSERGCSDFDSDSDFCSGSGSDSGSDYDSDCSDCSDCFA